MLVLLNFYFVAAVFLLDTFMPIGIEIEMLYVVPVAGLTLWSTQKDSSLVILAAAICTALTIVVFLLAPANFPWIGIVNRTIAIFLVWFTAMLLISRKRAEVQTKILSQLLPICSYCKKIRDSEGCWNQIETYIAAHSEINFTHSVCPECAVRHFPHVFKQVGI
jgi:hypothetical protein